MEELKEQVNDFLTKISELKSCKFIMAPTKIKDVLKSIVNSRTLYDLFMSVSSQFDYLSAKSRCLVDVSDGFSNKGLVVLPQSARDKLAFVFCLLVEIDRDSINFNWFLQKYFSDDGSFYGCYQAFCEQIIVPFERIIRDAFSDYIDSPEETSVSAAADGGQPAAAPLAGLSNALSAIYLLIAQEKQFIFESAIPSDDKETGLKMLTEIYNALKKRDFEVANSLVNGYNYYILYNNTISPGVQSLFESIQSYEGV